jgi:precorrin-6B methylase 1
MVSSKFSMSSSLCEQFDRAGILKDHKMTTDDCTQLTIVGTGIAGPGQVTVEARGAISYAEVVFALLADPLTQAWLKELRPDVIDLSGEYAAGRARLESYQRMVDRILEPVRRSKRVCAVFYGHPGVFAIPSHHAIRVARQEGFSARMLPGISAEDCLFADLGVDPGRFGCQSFEATDFLVHRRRFDPAAGLILWQIGVMAVEDHRDDLLWNIDGLRVLVEVLLENYPPSHEVVVYEATTLPLFGPKVVTVRLEMLPLAPVTALSTLWIKPVADREPEIEMLKRLGLATQAWGKRR